MSAVMTAEQVLDREFLEIRAKVLELAAFFDRLGRGEGCVEADLRMRLLQQALEALNSGHDDRAEQVQLIFSRAYEDNWREQFGL